MFRAVNQETESERRRVMFERQKIINMYLSSTKSLNIDRFFNLKVQFEQNHSIFEGAKSNLLVSLVRRTNLKKLEDMLDRYSVIETKNAFFEYVKKLIEDEQFIKAKKLLNLARQKGWFNNEFFEYRNMIGKKYFKGEKIKEKPKFEDFL